MCFDEQLGLLGLRTGVLLGRSRLDRLNLRTEEELEIGALEGRCRRMGVAASLILDHGLEFRVQLFGLGELGVWQRFVELSLPG